MLLQKKRKKKKRESEQNISAVSPNILFFSSEHLINLNFFFNKSSFEETPCPG